MKAEARRGLLHVISILVILPILRIQAQDPNVAAAQGRTGWRQLDLAYTRIADASVYYERSLEPNLPQFEKVYREVLDRQARAMEFLGQSDKLIADMNQAIGPTNPDVRRMQERALRTVGKLLSVQRPTFYLVRGATLKDFVKAGGQLPDCTYDKSTDRGIYQPRIERGDLRENGPIELAIPISTGERIETAASAMLKPLGDNLLGLALHETVELGIVARMKPTDPYVRWFTDGSANVVTLELLDRYAGRLVAEQFRATCDPNGSQERKDTINLRYWSLAQWQIRLPAALPVAQFFDRLERARYAYATQEIRGLVDRQGMSVIARILKALEIRSSRGGDDLLSAVQEVTGEDMAERISRYQTFAGRREGVQKYAEAFKAADQKQDVEQMLVYFLLGLELRDDRSLLDWKTVAVCLSRLGDAEAADRVMQKGVEEDQAEHSNTQAKINEVLMLYALESQNPRKSLAIAEDCLRSDPNHLIALTIKMLSAGQSGNTLEARSTATKLLTIAPKECPAIEWARQILKARDPNAR